MATQFMLRLGIDPENLYRATFICQDGLCCCNMALISFRLFRKNLGNLGDFFGQMVYRPPWQKISRTPMRCIMNFSRRSRSVVVKEREREPKSVMSVNSCSYDPSSWLLQLPNIFTNNSLRSKYSKTPRIRTQNFTSQPEQVLI